MLWVAPLSNLCLRCRLSRAFRTSYHETALPLRPLVTGWPLTLSFYICIHTRTLPGLRLKKCVMQSRMQLRSCWRIERLSTGRTGVWVICCLSGFNRDSHIWYIMLSSLCLFYFSPPSLSLLPQSPLQRFLIKIMSPKWRTAKAFALRWGGDMRCDKWLRINRM